MNDETITAREAARRRMPLDGADAQALEGALAMTERERDAAIAARAESEAALGLLRDQWDAMVRERDAYGARLEHERTKRDFLERELASCREKGERLSEQVSEARQAIGGA